MVWGLLVWIPGIPYERDCYLVVTLESQATKPNHQFPISWSSQHPQQVVVFPLAKNPTFGKCRVTPWWPFFGKLTYNVTIDSIKQQWVYIFHVYEGTPPKKNFTICTVTTLLQCFGRIQNYPHFSFDNLTPGHTITAETYGHPDHCDHCPDHHHLSDHHQPNHTDDHQPNDTDHHQPNDRYLELFLWWLPSLKLTWHQNFGGWETILSGFGLFSVFFCS